MKLQNPPNVPPTALALILYLCASTLCLATPPSGYYLVWSDEFNGASLDTTKWALRLGGAYRDGYNTLNAVSFNGSNMVITTYTQNGTNFTAMLYAKGKFESKFGYWESNIKWADSNAEWSSPFLLSRNYSLNSTQLAAAPDNIDPATFGSEIDMCEHRYVDSSNTKIIAPYVQVNLHWKNGTASVDDPGSPLVPSTGGLDTGFHTYGFLWKTNSYAFLVDDVQVYSNRTTTPVVRAAEYPLLTSAVDDTSTTWAGLIPSGGYGSQSTSATKYTLDYIRYYAPTNVLFWTGASSAFWNNSANWISNFLPAANCDLTFNYQSGNRTMTLGQDFSVDGLVFLGANGAFALNAGNTLTLGAGGIDMISANNNVTLNAAINVASNQGWAIGPNDPSGNLTLTDNGNLSGTGTLTKTSYGVLVLTGANGFSGALNVDTGTTNNDGILKIANSAAIANVASISIRNTNLGISTLQLDGSAGGVVCPQNLGLAGRNTSVIAVENLSGNSSLGGITLAGGGSNYWIQCDSGTLTVGGIVSAGSTATGARLLTLQGNGSFSIPGSIQNGSAAALSVAKTNAGTLTLSGTNNFTGGTTNWRGTMLVNGSLAGPLAVNGGILSGIGAIAGATMVQSGVEVTPGTALANSIGTLTFANNLTLAPGSTTYLEINAALNTNDQLNVAGTMTCGGTLNVANLAGTLAAGQSFKLFSAGTVTGSFSALSLPALSAGLAWNTNQLSNGLLSVISVSPPESLTFTNTGAHQMWLNWNYGTLQSASDVTGPYSDITDAVPPYQIFMTNPWQFYRIREN